MKFYAHLFVVTFIFFLVLTGCKKNDDVTDPGTTTETLSDDEVADAVAKSLVSGESGCGLTGVVNISAENSNGTVLTLQPNNLNAPNIDSTIHKTGNTTYATYDYYLSLKIRFIKKGQEYLIYPPTCDTAKVNIMAYGSVTAKTGRYSYHDSTYLSNTYLSGISPSSDTITLSGIAYYFSTFTVTATNKTYTLATMMTFTSLKAPKSTNQISSGTVTVALEATLKSGKKVNYTGTITFIGNQTATLTFNGKTYTINLNSGSVTV
ncbi:MAG: hypothetical protein Q8N83_13195 [Ignavibacteria bacterium]|nr:hypothetical protein [Ignavibacteria bacterium]